MKRFLASTVAASALALMLAMPPASAEETLDPNAKQGGAIIITYKDDVATLDPAIGYDWQNWSMIKSLFDGLMDYEPGTTTLRPDLAESYEISPDGKTFTFKLRHGVKFHNGREMTADDVKYSLDRVTNPKTQSPGAGFFASIKGYDAVAGGTAESLEGVTVVDPLHGQVRADAARRHLPACHGDQLLACRAEGRGREVRRRFRQASGRHRRLQARPNGRSASASSSSATPTTGTRACRISTRSPSRSARSRSSRCCACRRARSTCPATASRRPSSRR